MAGVTFIDVSSKGIEAAAAGISELRVEPLEGPSRFIKPQSVRFKHQQRHEKPYTVMVWEGDLPDPNLIWQKCADKAMGHGGKSPFRVRCVIPHRMQVRQFRPAVYAAALAACVELSLSRKEETPPEPPPVALGFTYELCAGIVDKPGLSLEEIAKEEVLEEVGYTVDGLQQIGCAVGAVGISGALQTYYFGEVDESMRKHSGGGNTIEGEEIDVVGLPINQIDNFVADNSLAKPPGVLFGALWLKNHLGLR